MLAGTHHNTGHLIQHQRDTVRVDPIKVKLTCRRGFSVSGPSIFNPANGDLAGDVFI
jgi:hypothetical protein